MLEARRRGRYTKWSMTKCLVDGVVARLWPWTRRQKRKPRDGPVGKNSLTAYRASRPRYFQQRRREGSVRATPDGGERLLFVNGCLWTPLTRKDGVALVAPSFCFHFCDAVSRLSVLDGFFNLAQLDLISQTSSLEGGDIYPHLLSKSFNPLLTAKS